MKFVSVKYHRPEIARDAYGGNAYTYKTQLPLNVGDKVFAPTKKEPMARAIVVDSEVPAESISGAVLPILREITQYDTEGIT